MNKSLFAALLALFVLKPLRAAYTSRTVPAEPAGQVGRA